MLDCKKLKQKGIFTFFLSKVINDSKIKKYGKQKFFQIVVLMAMAHCAEHEFLILNQRMEEETHDIC